PTITLLIVGCVALLILVMLNLIAGGRAQDAFGVVNESRETRSLAASLRSALQAAESSQRGYLLTRNEIYLAPFATAATEAERNLGLLKERAASYGDPAMQRLDTLVQDKLAELNESVELQRDGQTDEAHKIIATHRGKALMDEANVFLSAITRSAERALTDAVEQQQDSLQILSISTYLAVLLVFAVTAGVYVIQRSFVHDLRRANDEIRSINDDLERRVEERTHDLEVARDRAEMLLAEVNHRVANSLTMVASMVAMQARASGNEEVRKILANTQARINAVATVHKQLYSSTEVQTIALDDFLPKLVEDIEGSMRGEGLSARVSKEVEQIALTTDQTISLGIILSEWVTNAYKYAYPDRSGDIRVKLRKAGDGTAILSVEDDGIGRGQEPVAQGTGLGSKLVQAMATALGGKISYVDRNPGTEARLILPLSLGARGSANA
ncbi:MAG TPA: CHASE3 domain-containing protein, partial [Tabrizicola sp.]